jgi:hypothetical protein
MRWATLALGLLLFLAPRFATAETALRPELLPEWLLCMSASECDLLHTACCGEYAVNSRYRKDAQSSLLATCSACLGTVFTSDPNAAASCDHGQCIIIHEPRVICQGHCGQWQPEWLSCQADADCALVQMCGDAAINKAYVFQANVLNRQCQQTSRPNPDAIAQCINHQCKVTIPTDRGSLQHSTQ